MLQRVDESALAGPTTSYHDRTVTGANQSLIVRSLDEGAIEHVAVGLSSNVAKKVCSHLRVPGLSAARISRWLAESMYSIHTKNGTPAWTSSCPKTQTNLRLARRPAWSPSRTALFLP